MKISVRTAIIGCALLLVSLNLSCGYGSNYNSSSGSVSAPNISGLAPNNTMAGSTGFVLTVNGSNFGTDSVVYWSSSVRATTYVSGNQITANISSSDVATTGTVQVYVHSGGQNSNMMNFMIN